MVKTRMPDEPPQVERFTTVARELGCDESEAAFEDKLRQIAKAKPKADDEPIKREK